MLRVVCSVFVLCVCFLGGRVGMKVDFLNIMRVFSCWGAISNSALAGRDLVLDLAPSVAC